MECLKLFDDQPNSHKGSLLCYCDVPALILSSTELNNTKPNLLVTCSKHNELGFRCNMREWLYNETSEHDCKKLLDMRREGYKLSLNHGPIPMKKDVGMCKLKVWYYSSAKSEAVSTFNMDTYRSWDEEKIAHKRARSWTHYLEHLNRDLVRENQHLRLYQPYPTLVQHLRLNEPSRRPLQHFRLNEPSPTPLQLRVRPGRPAFKKIVATRSTWSDKNWSTEENDILEGVPVSKITELGL
ncbi:hypothetical protein ACFE04_030664 [Oxalis oulophora]